MVPFLLNNFSASCLFTQQHSTPRQLMDVLQRGDLPKFVVEDVKGEVIYCQTCKALLLGPFQWQDHRKGTKHKRKTCEQSKEMNELLLAWTANIMQ